MLFFSGLCTGALFLYVSQAVVGVVQNTTDAEFRYLTVLADISIEKTL